MAQPPISVYQCCLCTFFFGDLSPQHIHMFPHHQVIAAIEKLPKPLTPRCSEVLKGEDLGDEMVFLCFSAWLWRSLMVGNVTCDEWTVNAVGWILHHPNGRSDRPGSQNPNSLVSSNIMGNPLWLEVSNWEINCKSWTFHFLGISKRSKR